MIDKTELLKLDLQTFANPEGGTEPEGGDNPEGTQPEGSENTPTTSSDGTEKPEEQVGGDKIPYDRFKQKVDEVNALKARLDQVEKDKKEARLKELEEQEKYKELYEEAMSKIEAEKEARKESDKKSALTDAGYTEEQIGFMLKLVEGDTEEEYKKSIETLKNTFPVQKTYVDPSPDNGGRRTPKPIDGEDYGKDMFKKLFEKGKLRGFKK